MAQVKLRVDLRPLQNHLSDSCVKCLALLRQDLMILTHHEKGRKARSVLYGSVLIRSWLQREDAPALFQVEMSLLMLF